MSKRGAVGPQGDKDSDLFAFNMASTPEEKPQRATAAQMAHRKIKDIRRRTRPSTTAPSATGATFSPFNSIDPNTVSGSQPATNGFSFGQSQSLSFPGASPNPSQPTQNGGSPFAFGSGGAGSSSFSFSTSFGGSGSSGNPFATLNTPAPSQPSDNTGFSGFKGSMFNVPPAGSSAPGQQSLPSGGLFGTGSQQTTAPGGIFGSTSTSAPSSQPVTTAPSTGSIFGQNNATSTAPSTTLFGQSTSDKPSPFGQSIAFGSDSMQTSPDPKANAAVSKPAIFGGSASQPAFGASTGFGSPAGGSVFGGATPAAQQTPAKPLFGTKPTEQATPTSTPLFGATSQQPTAGATAPTPASTSATPTTTTATTLFGTASPAKPATPFQNPFQSSNLFSGAPSPSATPKPVEEKGHEEKVGEAAPPKAGFQFSSSTAGGNLFSKSETAAAAPSTTSSAGLFQAPATGSLFALKPASAETDKPETPKANPFSSLFAPKPSTTTQATPEQKPSPAAAPFGSLFSPKPSTPNEGAKPVASTPAVSSAPPPSPSLFAPQPSSLSTTSAESKIQTPSSATTASQGIFKANGAAPAQPTPSAKPHAVQFAESLRPSKLPTELSEQQKKDFDLVYSLRMLNECFQREIARLNPSTDDFDAAVLFYMRVREVIGAPTAPMSHKRKATDDESADLEIQSAKKVKPFGTPSTNISSPSQMMNIGPSSITRTPSKLFDTNPTTPTTNGKMAEEKAETGVSVSLAENRSDSDSATASIFAQSFSKSKADDSETTSAVSPKPATPETNKPALFSTTPSASPAKSIFSSSTTTKENATSSSIFSQSTSNPGLTSSTSSVSTPAQNLFAPKPTGDGKTEAPAAPKFTAGTATNFFAQFKSIADKSAEKEKEKRKAEDFDSEEEDEAEWERKDAEQQRKKREELEAQSKKRAKFVPGKGFVFEDESSDTTEPKKPAETSTLTASSSVFEAKRDTAAKANNIFGHLSATPSEVEEDNDADDTEEASAAGEDADEESKESSVVPASDRDGSRDAETSEADSKAISVSGAEFSANESSDDGDFTRALTKSKQASGGGKSLFDRVQPKRQTDEEPKNPFSSLFSPSSKFSSSMTTPGTSTPNPFGSPSTPAPSQGDSAETKPSSSIFKSSVNTSGGLFTSGLASTGTSTPSIFGQSSSKPAGDKTWKPDSPIKFADSTATAPSTTSKPDSGPTAQSTDSSKPFSALFGAPAAGAKASGSGQSALGFSFGGPSQQSSSFLAPSTVTSATGSRASTPGLTSDTGAEESGDGEAAESLPQVDLARSRAGEEDEDIVIETRARALKIKPGAGWESQGVGYLRVLKNRNTSRSRIILRADPSGKVVLNAALLKDIKYTINANSVQFLVPQAEGAPEQWAVRVKGKEEAERLHSAVEKSKA
ncbi:RanBP1 domain protein [Aspergillus fischeri NRRL 181]|uniref:RNase3 domain protein n=1 Tax=Neosartorya fischeri (strain ATCC 1020 / DSM 3700 / CBS 544.65 / FGSC A1164 / JCM 1740 / NRRL 181 / WB 181) TaxID=331117 RepID=A1DP46_NEOFI|nr:RNase3 domain protein [Aspergillus fischeri NRRL 181]EAW16567.1 RNase3 domain protein [Aspergillus fischeri NRRL 181]